MDINNEYAIAYLHYINESKVFDIIKVDARNCAAVDVLFITHQILAEVLYNK